MVLEASLLELLVTIDEVEDEDLELLDEVDAFEDEETFLEEFEVKFDVVLGSCGSVDSVCSVNSVDSVDSE